MITVELNKRAIELSSGTTIVALLELVDVQPNGVAIALNGEVVPRSSWSSCVIEHGDQISLFHSIAGG